MDGDVGLEERSKRSKGESGPEVQSVEGAVEWKESKGGVLKVLAVEQTSSQVH